MNGNIRLSEKHGINPSIAVCFYCNEDKNEIIPPGKLKDDVEAPHRAVWNMEPCDTCKGYMEKAVIFISVDEAKSKGDMQNPWRTGGWCVMAEAYVRRVVQPEALAAAILKKRVAFLPDDTWDMLGLPRGEVKNG